MEDFKKVLKKRIAFASVYNFIVLILLLFGIFHMVVDSDSSAGNYISGFNMGICVGIQIVMAYYLGQYIRALKDETELKKLYIAEYDERTKFIEQKIGGKAVNFIIIGLGLATVISGYFSITVFFTLLATFIFSILVKLILKIYYSKLY